MFTFSLQSGSNGNAIYVETPGARLLFDAGISARRIAERLQAHGRLARDLNALIISHSHHDHVSSAGTLHRRFGVPIHITRATLAHVAGRIGKLRDVRHFDAGDTIRIGDALIHTIPTPHDALDSVAFVIECGRKRLGILTDLGHPFETLRPTIESVDAAYLESNYDPDMLELGSYPPDLKARIRGQGGHLSNIESAELLRGCNRSRLRWIALAHLSGENNHPDLALQTHRDTLGDDLPIWVASRESVSALYRVP